jgi:hypothetical protein
MFFCDPRAAASILLAFSQSSHIGAIAVVWISGCCSTLSASFRSCRRQPNIRKSKTSSPGGFSSLSPILTASTPHPVLPYAVSFRPRQPFLHCTWRTHRVASWGRALRTFWSNLAHTKWVAAGFTEVRRRAVFLSYPTVCRSCIAPLESTHSNAAPLLDTPRADSALMIRSQRSQRARRCVSRIILLRHGC